MSEHDPIIAAVEATNAELARIAAAGLQPGDQRHWRPEDFIFDADQKKFWLIPTGQLLDPESVDALVPKQNRYEGTDDAGKLKLLRPSVWLKQFENRFVVNGSTWWPGREPVINDIVVTVDGVLDVPGARTLNTYRAPQVEGGDPAQAGPWLDHVRTLFPEPTEHEQLFDCAAHMVQRPEEKCNRAIALIGEQGIGKNLLLEPLADAVGRHNAREIEPDILFDPFNSFVRSVLLVLNEARPSSDEHRQTEFYEKLKVLGAAPPHTLRMNEKHQKAVHVANLCRVFITTNHNSSLYIPANDRRMFVLRSMKPKGWAAEGYFRKYAEWSSGGGYRHVAAFLRERDLSRFDPGAEPPKTPAWHDIVSSWESGEGDELAHAIRELGEPDVVFGADLLRTTACDGLDTATEMKRLLKSRRQVAYRMRQLGYELVSSSDERKEWRYREGKADFAAASHS